MPDYIVTWTIDADDRPDPQSAAQQALADMRRVDSIANVFSVQDKATGETVEIDLLDIETM